MVSTAILSCSQLCLLWPKPVKDKLQHALHVFFGHAGTWARAMGHSIGDVWVWTDMFRLLQYITVNKCCRHSWWIAYRFTLGLRSLTLTAFYFFEFFDLLLSFHASNVDKHKVVCKSIPRYFHHVVKRTVCVLLIQPTRAFLSVYRPPNIMFWTQSMCKFMLPVAHNNSNRTFSDSASKWCSIKPIQQARAGHLQNIRERRISWSVKILHWPCGFVH